MKFIAEVSIWEHDEYIVVIRPVWEKFWKSLPIGYTLDKKDAKIIADWLNSSLPELWKIFENVNRDLQETTSNTPN